MRVSFIIACIWSMRSYEKLSTFGPSPGKTLSGRKNAHFCARQVCHGVTDVPREGTSVMKKPVFMPDVPVFGTSVTVGAEIRRGTRSYFPTLGAHRLPLRESAVPPSTTSGTNRPYNISSNTPHFEDRSQENGNLSSFEASFEDKWQENCRPSSNWAGKQRSVHKKGLLCARDYLILAL